MATVPPLVQLDHRGPQEAAVGVKVGAMEIPFPRKPKTTPEQAFRNVVGELRVLGMPEVACDGLLGLINQDSDADLSTDSDCLKLVTCVPEDAHRLLLEKFWKEEHRHNLGNAERSRDDLKNLSSKLTALATAMDRWWEIFRTDHLTKIVANPEQRALVRDTLQRRSTIADDLVKVLDATIDLASAENRLAERRAVLATMQQIERTRELALSTVTGEHGKKMADLQDRIKVIKEYIKAAEVNLVTDERSFEALKKDIKQHEASLDEAKRAAAKAKREEEAATAAAKKSEEEVRAAKEAYLIVGQPPSAAPGTDGGEGGSTRSDLSGSATLHKTTLTNAAEVEDALHRAVAAAADQRA